MVTLRIEGLPDDPLEAAAVFHAEWLPKVRALLDPVRAGEDIVLAFHPADHTHRDWRLAAVRGLAREAAPLRVNAVAGDEAAASAAATYLDSAPGVTGQYLSLDSAGAGAVVAFAP